MHLQTSKEYNELNNFVNQMLSMVHSFSLFLHLSSFYVTVYIVRLVNFSSKSTFITNYDLRKLFRFSLSHKK